MLYGKCSSYKDSQLCAATTPWEHQIHLRVSCCDVTQFGLQTKVLEPAQLAWEVHGGFQPTFHVDPGDSMYHVCPGVPGTGRTRVT